MYPKRRQILKCLPVLMLPGFSFAELLVQTPGQSRGPFYPDQLPLDKDNDLIIINDSLTPAVGEILHLSGLVLDARGRSLNNARVEIWQTDSQGRYIHSLDYNASENDRNFQGFGQFETDSRGRYRFRTIRPVAYGSGFARRTPHIHFSVTSAAYPPLTTQMYFADEENRNDGLWSRLSEAEKRLLTMRPQPLPESRLNEHSVSFNIVLG